MKSEPGPSATLGSSAAAGVRLIVWCRECGHQVEPDPAEQARRYGAEMTYQIGASSLSAGVIRVGGLRARAPRMTATDHKRRAAEKRRSMRKQLGEYKPKPDASSGARSGLKQTERPRTTPTWSRCTPLDADIDQRDILQ